MTELKTPFQKRVVVMFLLCASSLAIGTEQCPIVPRPKEYQVKGEPVLLERTATIVIGEQAGDPERYAASLLQRFVERRFKVQLPIRSEKDAGGGQKILHPDDCFGDAQNCFEVNDYSPK